MSNNYDPDWPSKDEMKEPKRLSFWQFLVGFALMEVVIAALAAFFSAGCSTVDPDAVYSIYTNIVFRVPDSPAPDAKMDGASTSGGAGESTSSIATGGKETDSGQGEKPASASPSVALDFKYGGFKGGNAKEDSRCKISKLKIGGSSLSFHWDTKIPSDWQRGDTKKGPMIIIAAFYKSGDRWVGGKFDWIDESRSTRSLENISGGYGGWDGSAWASAKKHAICVVSADGKWRSNLVED